MMTKGQLGSRITEAMMKFQREHMGRGPTEGKSFIIADMVIVRLQLMIVPSSPLDSMNLGSISGLAALRQQTHCPPCRRKRQ
jgi:uncharacterized protein YbcI